MTGPSYRRVALGLGAVGLALGLLAAPPGAGAQPSRPVPMIVRANRVIE